MADYFDYMPLYQLSVYAYFLPLVFGIYILGKMHVANRFFHALMMIALILISAFSKILFETLFPCKGSGVNWTAYAIIFALSGLFNYVLFTWLYIWKHTQLATLQETQLNTLCEKEFGSDSDTDEARQQQFEAEVEAILATTQ